MWWTDGFNRPYSKFWSRSSSRGFITAVTDSAPTGAHIPPLRRRRSIWGLSRPDPEVVADAKRRTFTAEYKQRILAEADAAAAQPGGIGALLRRERLYSSHLVTWRREREAGILKGLTPRVRGRKSKHSPLEEENQR